MEKQEETHLGGTLDLVQPNGHCLRQTNEITAAEVVEPRASVRRSAGC